MTDLPEILSALSRLNVHARAWGCGKKAIYAYKTFAAAEFATEARPVFVPVKCHHCNGTGIYRDWDGYERGPCYRCTKGIVTLRFVESTIGDFRWHHPTGNGGGNNVLNAVWGIESVLYPEAGGAYPHGVAKLSDGTERPIQFAPADDWGPNMPGAEKLPTDEACGLLNLVEDWIRCVPVMRPENRWTIGRARLEMSRYRIDLERDDDRTCCECGTADVMSSRCGGIGSKWRGGWTGFARFMCQACHGTDGALRWPRDPSPASLTPSVLAWLGKPERQVPFRCERDWND